MIISAKKIRAGIEKKHNDYIANRVRIFNKKSNWPKLAITKIFVNNNINLITSKKLCDLEKSINNYNREIKKLSSADRKIFKSDLQKLFSYSSLSRSKGNWNSREVCKLFSYQTCPYCNINYLEISQGNDPLYRPPLDHFFPESLYPHLAISLYNLVPSCTICNTNLKGDSDFYATRHLHPLFDSESIRFAVTNNLVEIRDNFKAIRNSIAIEITQHPRSERASNSIATFNIQGRYKQRRGEALGLISTLVGFNKSRSKEIQNAIDPAFDAESILQFEPADYRDFPLGRLKLDLFNQFFL